MNVVFSTEMCALSLPALPNPLGWRVDREAVNRKPSQRSTIYAATQVNLVTHRSSICEKKFRPVLWLARLSGQSSLKRASGCESGENFDLTTTH